MKKFFSNKRGAALVLVILTMVVLSLLGVVIMNVALGDTKLSLAHETKVQAEYIARAGADLAAMECMTKPTSYNNSILGDLVTGNFSADINEQDDDSILIQSTGTVETTSQEVSLLLKKLTFADIFNGVRQVGPSLEFDLEALEIQTDEDMMITANVSSKDNILLGDENTGSGDIIRATKSTPLTSAELPDTSDFEKNLPPVVDGVITFTGNYKLTNLKTKNKDNFVFYVEENENQYIVADTLSLTGPQATVTIQGGGTVHLYIDSGEIQNPINVNTDDPGKMIIYVAKDGNLELNANGTINAAIYAPEATIEFQSEKTTLVGAMVGNIIGKNDNSGPHGSFEYDPIYSNMDVDTITAYEKDQYVK